jgi:hypothetical protein
MSTPKRKRNVLDFRQKREIVEIKNPSISEVVKIYSHINISVVFTHAFPIKYFTTCSRGRLALISSLMFRKCHTSVILECLSIKVSKQAVKANRYRYENS